MDDDEIYRRGGDEDDVRRIAEQNGADLTERDVWLEDMGVREDDVMVDGEDREYVYSESDNGNPSEDGYGVDLKKVFLPIHLKKDL